MRTSQKVFNVVVKMPRWVLVVLVLAALAVLVVESPAPALAGYSGPLGGDTIAVNVKGLAHNTSSVPGHMVFSVPMFSLVDGAAAGSLTDELDCAPVLAPPCTVFDVTTTYHLPAGDIVSDGRWTGVADVSHPGFALVGTRPDHDTITGGTLAYTGAGGRVNGWGTIDAHGLPAELGYDIFTVIRLSPGGENVLGTGDRLSTHPPADRISQYFESDGRNTADEPFHLVARTTLFSLAGAKRFGNAVDDVTCAIGPPPCAVLDVVTHFAYAGGELEVRSAVSVVPDPQRPGFALVGARPGADTVTNASGIFAGKTGKVDISGSVDLRRFPAEAPFEGISLITLHP